MIVAVKRGQHDRGCQKGESEKGAGLQTIHIKRYALLVGAGLRITQATSYSDSESEIEASGATITPNSDNVEDHDPLNTENFETIEDLKQVKKNTNHNHHGNKF